MHKSYLLSAAIFGGLSVALGAFGAHGLEALTEDVKLLHGYQTAVQYQMYHALALLMVGLLYQKLPIKWIRWAGAAFIIGIILFSGSLYLITYLKLHSSNSINLVGPVTPLGGLFFILGWIFLVVAFIKGPVLKREL